MSYSRDSTTSGTGSIQGVAVAIVAENDDPQQRGRVTLRYPWLETAGESDWTRIAVPMAGPDRGTYFVPEVGDEVLVAFENGDIDYPYVVGSLWNGDDEPPTDAPDPDNDIRQIRSRSGHELTFADGSGEEGVTLETAAGHTIELDDDGETVTVEDTGGNRIEFDGAARELSISSDASISIEAPSIQISTTGNLDIEAGGVLTLDGALITLN